MVLTHSLFIWLQQLSSFLGTCDFVRGNNLEQHSLHLGKAPWVWAAMTFSRYLVGLLHINECNVNVTHRQPQHRGTCIKLATYKLIPGQMEGTTTFEAAF